MITLRPYQSEASASIIDALRSSLNPVAQVATGGGKSLIIGDVCGRLAANNGRIVVLAHRKELLEQNSKEYVRLTGRDDWGIVSSGLNENGWDKAVVFGGIQSMYRRAEQFRDTDLVMVDECDLVPTGEEGIMYTSFLKQVGTRRVGLSATPWRLSDGVVYGDGKPFDVLCYSKSPLDLVNDGYLVPLVGVDTAWQLDLHGVSKTGGDYSQSSIQDKMAKGEWIERAIDHAVKLLKGRKHIALFLPTISTAKKAAEEMVKHGISCGVVSSESDDRDEQLVAWRGGEIRAMASVDVISRGFNFPAIDAIVCLRPTESTALWIQMMGRAMRLAEGKKDALVIDMVGNLQRLGGVSTMETWSKQKQDGTMEKGSRSSGVVTPRKSLGNLALSTLDPMLETKQGLSVEVLGVAYAVRPSKTPSVSMLMAVYSAITNDGVSITANQFVCVEHKSAARYYAKKWFAARGYNSSIPERASLAKLIAYSLPTPRSLQLRKQDGYVNVIKETF